MQSQEIPLGSTAIRHLSLELKIIQSYAQKICERIYNLVNTLKFILGKLICDWLFSWLGQFSLISTHTENSLGTMIGTEHAKMNKGLPEGLPCKQRVCQGLWEHTGMKETLFRY